MQHPQDVGQDEGARDRADERRADRHAGRFDDPAVSLRPVDSVTEEALDLGEVAHGKRARQGGDDAR